MPLPRPQRSAALKLDWVKVTTSLGLRGQTVAGLQAFKTRNENARRKVQLLQELPTTVDFSQYRSLLKNQAIVDEIEKRFTSFKPATYDVSRQIKAIEAFEVEAVRNAEATREKVGLELKDLEKTLTNIETARPFEDLTVDEVAAAEPSIDEKTAKLVSKGRWDVPGYKVRLGIHHIEGAAQHTDTGNRRNLATCPCSRYLPPSRLFVYSSIVDSPDASRRKRDSDNGIPPLTSISHPPSDLYFSRHSLSLTFCPPPPPPPQSLPSISHSNPLTISPSASLASSNPGALNQNVCGQPTLTSTLTSTPASSSAIA